MYLTTYRGVVLPGLYNYDGGVFGLPIRKQRVKRLFSMPYGLTEKLPWLFPWHEIGLNA